MKIESVQITYNDEFDKSAYPIADWHRQAIIDLMNRLQMRFSTVWFYQATIHGRIFWFDDEKNRYHRLPADVIKALADMNGFRWIESGQGRVALGLAHEAPPTPLVASYHQHHKDNAEGHIHIDKKGPCTIGLVGAASMSQKELDFYGEIMADALRKTNNQE